MFLENPMLGNRLRVNRAVRLRSRSPVFVALALSLAMLVHSPVNSLAQEKHPGRDLYVQSCAPCHGVVGKGGVAESGPVGATLKTPPPDLTLVAKNNKGDFPFLMVMEVIDGRKILSRAHGTSEMPVWGAVFKAEAWNSDPVVAGKVLLLTEYIRSIQEK